MNWLTSTKLFSTITASAAVLAVSLSLNANAQLAPGGSVAQASDYQAAPPQVMTGADPFLLINLSVELTQQAEAFTDAKQTYANGTVCNDRTYPVYNPMLAQNNWTVGACYSGKEEYIGYFDPDKCYVYSDGGLNTNRLQQAEGPYGPYDPNGISFNGHYFVASGTTDSLHQCPAGTAFSGNFLNWSTMTAVDEFRSAMTGGARIVDTAGASARTILARAYRYDDWGFVPKVIDSSGIGGFTNAPNRVTPFNVSRLWVINRWWHGGYGGSSGHRVRFFDGSGNPLYISKSVTSLGTDAPYNVFVEVCNPSAPGGIEKNCVAYTDSSNTWYKPEGMLQKNAMRMRYALTSYTAESGSNNSINGGVLRSNAKFIGDLMPSSNGGIVNNTAKEIDDKGLIVYDPDGLYSATRNAVNSGILNYINQFALAAGKYKSYDPASELYYEGLRYIMGLSPTSSFSSGDSDFSYGADSDGYPIFNQSSGALSWVDPIVNNCQANFALYVGDQFTWQDGYVQTRSFNGLDVDVETSKVGVLEKYPNIPLGSYIRSGRNDGFWIAGMAYWANTNDVRPSIPGTQTVRTFVVDTQEYSTSAPQRQDNQLWMTAKYGGFQDANGDKDPNDGATNPDTPNTEWTSDTGANPVPDTYTLASQPANLVSGLSRVFNSVLQASSSASAAAVVANASQGVGAIYQAIYEPRLTSGSTAVTWTGTLKAFFIDSNALVREDTDQNGKLDANDKTVVYVKNPTNQTITADLYIGATRTDTGVQLRDLKPIWDARNQLASISNANVVTQRSYSGSAANGRYIFSWIDDTSSMSGVGSYDSGEEVDFDATTFAKFKDAGNQFDEARLLGLDSSYGSDSTVVQLATDLVEYIRGEDKPSLGWRNRTIDLGNGNQVQRLGDMVHSAPVVVGAPGADYDVRYGDATYLAYKQQYQDRRQVVYTGGNDGMLHAFNAGFFDISNTAFITQPVGTTGTSPTAHPLGSELWAYVPYNLLPHLRWLADPSYPHVYYVDGKPQVFDVNIFPSDSVHPNGWGTILVVGMRFGGGDITVDTDSDIDGNTSDDITMRSAYVVLDITDPESPPTILAEITHPQLGYTTSLPTVVKYRSADASGSFASPSANKWYLMFGSGPAGSTAATKTLALTNAISDQNARLFAFDLNNRAMVDLDSVAPGTDDPYMLSELTSFTGALVAQDWEQDYRDEVVYFGTVAGTVSAPTGSLYRIALSPTLSLGGSLSVHTMLSGVSKPFSAPPFPAKDVQGRPWVYAGTGRFFTSGDILSNAQQSYYGLKETVSLGAVDRTHTILSSNLFNTTTVEVFDNDTLINRNSSNLSSTTNTFLDMVQEILGGEGWIMDFSSSAAKYVDRTLMTRAQLVFTDYVTSGDSCAPAGNSNLYVVNMLTGTASPYAPLGTDPSVTNVNGKDMALKTKDLGFGQYFMAGIHRGAGGKETVIVTGSGSDVQGEALGTPTSTGARMSWREIPLD